MAIVTKNTLKSYFNRGDKPTEPQFENLIDSLTHVNDAGDSSSVDATSGSGVLAVNAGSFVEKVILTGTVSGNVKFGTTAGGEDILPEMPFDFAAPNAWQMVEVNWYFPVNGNFHITGAVNCKILLR